MSASTTQFSTALDGDEVILTIREGKEEKEKERKDGKEEKRGGDKICHSIVLNQFLPGDKEKLEELTCPICKELLTEPVLLNNDRKSPCHHTFCRECINKALVNKSECPTCKKQTIFRQVLSAPAIQRRLTNLEVACCYAHKGCSWRRPLGLGAKDYVAHLDSCLHRGEACKDCGLIVGWGRECLIKHGSVCGGKMVTCPHCSSPLLRQQLGSHEVECDEYPVSCEFKTLALALPGCQVLMKRRDYRRHCTEQMPQHLEVLDKERKKVETDWSSTKRKLETTEGKVKDLNRRLSIVRTRLADETKRRMDYSNQFRWRISDWKKKRKFSSPKLLASGILWEMSITKEKSDCDCDHEGHNNLEWAIITVKPQVPLVVDNFMKVMFVGENGKTVSWDEEEDEDEEGEMGRKFTGRICTSRLESSSSVEPDSIDVVLVVDLL